MIENPYFAQVKNAFASIDPKVELHWNHKLNYPGMIRGKLSPPSSEKPEQISRQFFITHKDLLQLEDIDEQLKLARVKTDSVGNSRSYFHQLYKGIPVWGGYITVYTNPDGVVTGFEAKYYTTIETRMVQDTVATLRRKDYKKGTISPEDAIAVAQKDSKGAQQGEPFLLIYPYQEICYLAYHVEVSGSDGEDPADWVYFIDAFTGQIINRYNTINFAGMVNGDGIGINKDETANSPQRSFRVYLDDDGKYYLRNTEYSPEVNVYDIAGGGFHNSYSGRDDLAVDTDGHWDDCTNSSRVDNQRPEAEGYWALHRISDYYARDKVVNGIHLFNRNGWDDNGGNWRMIMHCRDTAGANYNGSFFSRNATYGSRVYHGDGDGSNFTYKAVLDASAHEWVHGVQFSEIPAPSPGSYAGFDGSQPDPFCIQEATADVLACCLDTEGGGWHMGREFEEGIVYYTGTYVSAIGLRLRSLQNPSKYDDFSDHMDVAADSSGRGYIANTGADGYKNSTILSHACYLMAMGGKHPTGVAGYEEIQVIGQGVGFVENIVYRYLVHHAAAQDTLQDFRDKIIQSCQDLYPSDTCKEWCVKRAFDAVGLYDDTIGGVTDLPAGVNLNITPWGANSGQPPYWISPDVYCLDGSNNIVEPKKGMVNRLIAVVRNLGNTAANNATVNFFFSPFGFGYRHEDFKSIGSDTVNVPAGGTDVQAEVNWDLTDLTDDFGGLWPNPVSDFDHFCIRVEVVHQDEVYPCDNECQHNFSNVGTVPSGDGDGVWNFIIANPYKRPVWALVHVQSNLPSSMIHRLELFGEEQIPTDEMLAKPTHTPETSKLVALGPREKRMAQLRVFIPRAEALRLAEGPGGYRNLRSVSLAATVDGTEIGGMEVGFFGKELWNIPGRKDQY